MDELRWNGMVSTRGYNLKLRKGLIPWWKFILHPGLRKKVNKWLRECEKVLDEEMDKYGFKRL